MRPELEGFLRPIAADPDDFTTRLALADWLEENDEPAWSELIKLQLDLQQYVPHIWCGPCSVTKERGEDPYKLTVRTVVDCPAALLYGRVQEVVDLVFMEKGSVESYRAKIESLTYVNSSWGDSFGPTNVVASHDRFIHADSRLNQLRWRERQLLLEIEPRVLNELPGQSVRVWFERGLPYAIVCEWAIWHNYASRWTSLWPFTHVGLTGQPPTFEFAPKQWRAVTTEDYRKKFKQVRRWFTEHLQFLASGSGVIMRQTGMMNHGYVGASGVVPGWQTDTRTPWEMWQDREGSE